MTTDAQAKAGRTSIGDRPFIYCAVIGLVLFFGLGYV